MRDALRLVQEKARQCVECQSKGLLHKEPDQGWARPLFQKRVSGTARVVFVAEAPNWDDTFDVGKGHVTIESDGDPSGSFLLRLLKGVGLSIDDILMTNSVLCLPAVASDGAYPVTAAQRDQCSPWLVQIIEASSASVVVTLGGKALEALGRVSPHGLELKSAVGQRHRWRGLTLVPLYHPSRLGRRNRSESDQIADFEVLRSFARKCSACGSTNDLHLVIFPYGEASNAPGRMLLDCAACRMLPERRSKYGASIPITLIDETMFLRLYELGLTSSDPQQACEIVFGEHRPVLIGHAIEILKSSDGRP